MSQCQRSLITLCLQAALLATVVLLLAGPVARVEAGKKEKILLGLAVAHGLRSQARDHSLLRLIVPLRMATEAWKRYGELAAHHGHHHGYGHHHHHIGYGHHGFELDDHEYGHHFKA